MKSLPKIQSVHWIEECDDVPALKDILTVVISDKDQLETKGKFINDFTSTPPKFEIQYYLILL